MRAIHSSTTSRDVRAGGSGVGVARCGSTSRATTDYVQRDRRLLKEAMQLHRHVDQVLSIRIGKLDRVRIGREAEGADAARPSEMFHPVQQRRTCRGWRDARAGSHRQFRRGIARLAEKIGNARHSGDGRESALRWNRHGIGTSFPSSRSSAQSRARSVPSCHCDDESPFVQFAREFEQSRSSMMM